jgi:hypothetical protein
VGWEGEDRRRGGEAGVVAAVGDLVHERVVIQALHLLLGLATVVVLVGAPVVAPVDCNMQRCKSVKQP